MVNDNRLQFWEDRSALGYSAWSGDIVLKSLEITQQERKLPVYDSVINNMSLKLDPLPICGQTKIIIFDKV